MISTRHAAPPLPQIVIVGASVRAAAFSALRAGYLPYCCDQFADADLQAAARAVHVADYPEGLVAAADQFPDAPLIYTGGLENHPRVITEFARQHPLLGCPAETVRLARDPFGVADGIRQVRLPALEVRSAADPPPPDGTWLLRPIRSAAGKGIEVWTPQAAASPALRHAHYFQRRAEGTPCSATFIASEGIGDVRFVGITEQLIAEPELHAPPFAWCGNIGPVALPVSAEQSLHRMANFFKWKFQLRGLFGLDFIAAPDGIVWLTELNPRYTGSVELLEFATGQSLLADHCDCFAAAPPTRKSPAWTPTTDKLLGKAVLYAPRATNVNFTSPLPPETYRAWPRLADVPPAGTRIERGDPLCTVFASGDTIRMCRERLFAAACQLYEQLPADG